MSSFVLSSHLSKLLRLISDDVDALVGSAGMRVMNPTWQYWPTFLDVYPNIRLVTKIEAPLLILHVRNTSHIWIL